jgi:TRAP-type uncharacterized transport system fused permease subunit
MIATTLGLTAFASGIERYFIRRATWLETILFWGAALGLFWPTYWSDAAGFLALVGAVVMQKVYTPDRGSGTRSK